MCQSPYRSNVRAEAVTGAFRMTEKRRWVERP
jgi:hypothetical protein